MNQAAARTLFRLWTNELDSSVLSDANIDLLIQSGQESLCDLVGYHFTDDSTNVVLVDGTQEYALPAAALEVLWVEWNGFQLRKTDTEQLQGDDTNWRAYRASHPESYYTYGRQIGFFPKPNADAVAKAASPVIRYISVPTEFSSTAFNQLASQHHRLPIMYAVGEWFETPNAGVRTDLAKPWWDRFKIRAEGAKAHYASLRLKR